MARIVWLLLAIASVISAQSADTQTLQALLQELRQLRQDMYSLTLAAQRANILLYRVQLQETATQKASLRYDQASNKVKDAERNYSEASNELKKAEERLASMQTPKERGEGEAIVREMKRRVEMWSQDQHGYRATEVTAGSDLKVEQAKLSELQERLSQLERQLESYPSGSAAK